MRNQIKAFASIGRWTL